MVEDATRVEFPKYEYIEVYHTPYWLSGRNIWADWDSPRKSKSSAGKRKEEDIPEDCLQEWEALLDYYSFDELKEIHEEFGDEMIHHMYMDEIGYAYGDDEDWEAALCGR